MMYRLPAIGTVERARYDIERRDWRHAWRNRTACACGSGRLADPPDNTCIACHPSTKPAWDAWARTHKGSVT